MKMISRWLLIVLLAVVGAIDTSARGHSSGGGHSSSSSSSTRSSGTVSVRGYYRHNGTYVQPYVRRAPGTAVDSAASAAGGVTSDSQSLVEQTKETPVKEKLSSQELSARADHAAAIKEQLVLRKLLRELSTGTDYSTAVQKVSAKPTRIRWATRDLRGRIKRSEAAKHEFMRMTGYPHGRPGYVVDHIMPLKRGGPDIPANMQWQTVEEAKAKDKWE
jgi:hypothetical protein